MLVRSPIRALSAAAIAFALSACSGGSTSPQPSGAARAALPRALTPAERNVLGSANAFSFALWRAINNAQVDSNVFVSPLSASFALGMTLNGAASGTADEMRTALQFGGASLADIDAGYKSLVDLLVTLDPTVTMQVANSIWYRNGFPFRQSFLDAGRTWFDATVTPLDFNQVSPSLATINSWVNDKTHGKIPTILESISPDDVMFLINAIYFKGSWRSRFDPAKTVTAPFHGVGGDQSASLMRKQERMPYVHTPTYDAVDLAYGDSAFMMTVILPQAGTSVEQVAASLTPEGWSALANGFGSALVDLSLPKLRLEWKRGLIPDLQALGMRAAFSPIAADFSNMSAGGGLYLSLVRQKTFVDINEEGTEAAAVTAVGVTVTSAPVVQVVRVDRPFIFAIRERLSGTVLFMGKIVRMP